MTDKKKLTADEERAVIVEAKKHLQDADSAESEFRFNFVEDLRFVYDDGGQWEPEVKASRVGRPCYTFNRTEGAIDQVVGDQRQARPSINVRAAEDGDKKLAATYSGLIRNIENNSHADTIYDHAFTFATAAGYGVWRVKGEFTADDSFNQDIFIKEIADPLTVYFDPIATDICKRDGRRVLITELIPEDEFEETYPDKLPADFESTSEGPNWYEEKQVRIAEYYRKVSTNRELIRFKDGTVTFMDEVSDVIDEEEERRGGIVKPRL